MNNRYSIFSLIRNWLRHNGHWSRAWHDPDPQREAFLLEHGFIERIGNSRLRCTPAGMLVLDSVVADLAC